jgi:hypothetical protein
MKTRAIVIGATLVTVLFSGIVDAAPAKKSIPPPAMPTATKHDFVPPGLTKAVREERDASWGAALPSIAVKNNNTGEAGTFRLYTDHGSLDLDTAKHFMTLVNGAGGKLDTRLVQIVFRAAYHFSGASMAIVSGTRRGAHGKHGTNQALDFKLEGVSASELAKYVRTYPRAGIGIYTHPKTQYVHVDVRDRSYHWIDASPPGVSWREHLLPDPKQAERDASYTAAGDLPESAR